MRVETLGMGGFGRVELVSLECPYYVYCILNSC